MVCKAVVMLLAALLVAHSCAASRQVLHDGYGDDHGHDIVSPRAPASELGPASRPLAPEPKPTPSPRNMDIMPSGPGGLHSGRQLLDRSGSPSPPNDYIAVGYSHNGAEGTWGAKASHTEDVGGAKVTVEGHVDSKGNSGGSVTRTDTKKGRDH
jgi:hypothetical protein